MLLKNLINNLPEKKKNIVVTGLSTNSKNVKKGHIFLQLKEVVLMEINLLKKQ